MRILVTGASGWIGSAVVPQLLDSGHQVTGVARSDASAAAIEAAGSTVLRGDLDHPEQLAEAAAEHDGVVHLAFGHDFSRFQESIATDVRVVETIGAALVGTGKPLVIASGTPAVPGRLATEDDRPAPDSPAAFREGATEAALRLAEQGVRTAVVRLPRSVHGEGDHGFVPQLIRMAREAGVSGYVEESNRWPAVHVQDAAALFRLAVDQAPAGSVLHAVGDEGVPTGELAAVIGDQVGVPTAARPAEEMGFLGGLLAIDQPASAEITRERLGWNPTRPGLLADVRAHYVG